MDLLAQTYLDIVENVSRFLTMHGQRKEMKQAGGAMAYQHLYQIKNTDS